MSNSGSLLKTRQQRAEVEYRKMELVKAPGVSKIRLFLSQRTSVGCQRGVTSTQRKRVEKTGIRVVQQPNIRAATRRMCS
eukprot:13309575-Ditylum_brightwellii.AAC.1